MWGLDETNSSKCLSLFSLWCLFSAGSWLVHFPLPPSHHIFIGEVFWTLPVFLTAFVPPLCHRCWRPLFFFFLNKRGSCRRPPVVVARFCLFWYPPCRRRISPANDNTSIPLKILVRLSAHTQCSRGRPTSWRRKYTRTRIRREWFWCGTFLGTPQSLWHFSPLMKYDMLN